MTFGGSVAAASYSASATSITATVPAGAVSGALRVTTAGGTAVSAASFTITAPAAPVITSFSPGSGPVGQSVTVSGSGFTGVTSVKLNNQPVTFNVANAGSLSFAVPVGAASGKISVLASGGLMISATDFTVIPAPTVTSFSPTSGAAGTSVTITGTNLTGATQVRFNGVNAPGFVVNATGTSITVSVPGGATTGAVSVTTAAGTGASASAFTVTSSAPTITGLSPASGIIGSQVTITGANLSGATGVNFNGKAVESYLIQNATTVTATVPGDATTGTVSVTTGFGTAVSPMPFTVLAVPDIDVLRPARGPVGTVVTLTGTGLSGVTSVTFGGVAASTFAAASATSATATVPAGATTGQVSLTNPIATAISAQVFTLTMPRPGGVAWVAVEPVRIIPYPNPVGNAARLTVQVLNRRALLGSAEVYLLDALGRKVQTAPLDVAKGEAVFELTGLAGGVYIVRCGAVAEQVLIQR